MKSTAPEPTETDWDAYMDAALPEESQREEEPEERSPARVPAAGKRGGRADSARNAFLKLKLEDLLFSSRTLQALKKQGLKTLGALVCRTATQLRAIPGLGAKGWAEIEEALDYYALSLPLEPPAKTSPHRSSPAIPKGKETAPLAKPMLPRPTQLSLPETNDRLYPRLCLHCRTALLPEATLTRFCGKECQVAWNEQYRPVRQKRVEPNPFQLAWEF